MFNEQTPIRIQPTTPGKCGAREQGETTTAWIKYLHRRIVLALNLWRGVGSHMSEDALNRQGSGSFGMFGSNNGNIRREIGPSKGEKLYRPVFPSYQEIIGERSTALTCSFPSIRHYRYETTRMASKTTDSRSAASIRDSCRIWFGFGSVVNVIKWANLAIINRREAKNSKTLSMLVLCPEATTGPGDGGPSARGNKSRGFGIT